MNIPTTPILYDGKEIHVHYNNENSTQYFLLDDVLPYFGRCDSYSFTEDISSNENNLIDDEAEEIFVSGRELLKYHEQSREKNDSKFFQWLSSVIKDFDMKKQPIRFASSVVRKRLDKLLKEDIGLSDKVVTDLTYKTSKNLFGKFIPKNKMNERQLLDLLCLEYYLYQYVVSNEIDDMSDIYSKITNLAKSIRKIGLTRKKVRVPVDC